MSEEKYQVEVEVHKPINNGYRVKVKVPSLGIYLNGVRVFPPNETKSWAVYPASTWVGNRWARMTEFNTKLQLWQDIFSSSIEAVKKYRTQPTTKAVRSTSEFDELMDEDSYKAALDALPFD